MKVEGTTKTGLSVKSTYFLKMSRCLAHLFKKLELESIRLKNKIGVLRVKIYWERSVKIREKYISRKIRELAYTATPVATSVVVNCHLVWKSAIANPLIFIISH